MAPIRWYSPAFRNGPASRLGDHIKGTKEACLKAVEMHENIVKELPWCTAIGWDTMTTLGEKPQVFFEGNVAISRLRRHLFASPAILAETCRLLAPIRFFGINIFSSNLK